MVVIYLVGSMGGKQRIDSAGIMRLRILCFTLTQRLWLASTEYKILPCDFFFFICCNFHIAGIYVFSNNLNQLLYLCISSLPNDN